MLIKYSSCFHSVNIVLRDRSRQLQLTRWSCSVPRNACDTQGPPPPINQKHDRVGRALDDGLPVAGNIVCAFVVGVARRPPRLSLDATPTFVAVRRIHRYYFLKHFIITVVFPAAMSS
jgi:hypothetical protein